MATAMGVEKPAVKTRQIRSAGSRRVTLPETKSMTKLNKGRGDVLYVKLFV